jgi:5-carboxymethyl-2-hydroxymuconate isomerase
MPHLVILYTKNIETLTNMTQLCRKLADVMIIQKDDSDKLVFPTGGTRVLAYPAAHHAVADDGSTGRAAGGTGDYGFVYLNVRMGKGRSSSVHQRVGDALIGATKLHLEPVFKNHHIGVTLQIDEGHEVFDAKHSTLHPLFNPS